MEIIYLYIDEIKSNGMYGFTKNVKKVFRNIEAMGIEIEQDIAIRIPLVEEYLTTVNRDGRFICVIRIKKDESLARMDLFDHTFISKNQINDIANVMFGKYAGLSDLFINCYNNLSSSFSPKEDKVELLLS